MKFWQNFKKWLIGGCVYFTVISLIMIFGKLMLDGVENAGHIHTTSFLLFFPFGLCMSAAGMLFSCKRIASWIQFFLHFVITLLSILLFIWFPSNPSASPSMGLIMFVMIALLYWIFLGLVVWIRSRVRKLMEED